LRRIIEGFRLKNLPLTLIFVDFTKALDYVDRDCIWKILGAYGFPDKIINAIKCLYTNSKSRVRVVGELSDEFDVTSGVLQGDVLAPFLFVTVVNYIMNLLPKNIGITTHIDPVLTLKYLAYADDTVLLSSYP